MWETSPKVHVLEVGAPRKQNEKVAEVGPRAKVLAHRGHEDEHLVDSQRKRVLRSKANPSLL